VTPEYILANVSGSRTGGAELERLRVEDPEAFDFYTNPNNYNFKNHQIVKSLIQIGLMKSIITHL
jgi:hypothetical protein